MKIFTNNTFEGHWPVGSAAVVSAASKKSAAKKLQHVLEKQGLHQEILAEDMIELKDSEEVRILCDGSY